MIAISNAPWLSRPCRPSPWLTRRRRPSDRPSEAPKRAKNPIGPAPLSRIQWNPKKPKLSARSLSGSESSRTTSTRSNRRSKNQGQKVGQKQQLLSPAERSRYCQMGNCTTRQMRNDHQEFCLRTSDVFVSVAKPLQMKPLLMCRFYLEPLQYFLSLLQCSEEDNTAASVRMNHRHFRLSLCMILSNYATHNDIAFSISIYFEVLDFNRSLHSSLLSLQNPLEMITDAGWEWANKSSLSS